MKKKIIFINIAVFAVLAAYSNIRFSTHHYQFLSESAVRYQVDPTDLVPGTGPGQFTCTASSNICEVNTVDIIPYQDVDGNWYIDKQNNVTTTLGTFTVH